MVPKKFCMVLIRSIHFYMLFECPLCARSDIANFVSRIQQDLLDERRQHYGLQFVITLREILFYRSNTP